MTQSVFQDERLTGVSLPGHDTVCLPGRDTVCLPGRDTSLSSRT